MSPDGKLIGIVHCSSGDWQEGDEVIIHNSLLAEQIEYPDRFVVRTPNVNWLLRKVAAKGAARSTKRDNIIKLTDWRKKKK